MPAVVLFVKIPALVIRAVVWERASICRLVRTPEGVLFVGILVAEAVVVRVEKIIFPQLIGAKAVPVPVREKAVVAEIRVEV